MKVKSIALIWQAAILFGFAIVSTSLAAQVVVPTKLSGRWTSQDGRVGQAISANIDPVTAKGNLTVWSNKSVCSIHDAPIAVTVDGDKLILKVDPSYSNPCRSDISVELTKKVDSDSYEGELRQKGDVFQVLDVKMSP